MNKDCYGETEIKKYLLSKAEILFFDSVGSTNDVLKSLAAEGAPEGTVAVARFQTKGKGRMGRSFYSPSDTGIYLSILLRPDKMTDISLLTPAAAVAVAETIESVTGKKTGIKWVNDVLIDGKKICGILCESVFGSDGAPECVIAGIGVNVFEPEEGFPEEIRNTAGSVCRAEDALSDPDLRSKLAAGITDRFLSLYKEQSETPIAALYKKRLCMFGKRISVIRNGEEKQATAVDTDGKCRLVVRYDDGSEETLFFGEVSCRLI